MREINATYTKKENLLRQQEQIYFNTQCKDPKCILNVGLIEGIWPLRAFLAMSMIPGDLHPDKTTLFPFLSVSRICGKSKIVHNEESNFQAQFQENAKNKNTQQSTSNWLKVWKSWASQKGYDESIEKYEAEALSKILDEFYATVRKKHGEDYEPDSLRVMVTAIDRYLAEKEYKHSTIRDREFKSSKQVLEGKARLLPQQGKGKRSNKARSLTTTEENELWEKKKLGKGSPQVLVQTVWWLLTQYFGLRGRQEHHSMTVEDFSFGLDENNTEYVEFIENLLPKMFATGDDRCPVAIFKDFLWCRPAEIRTTGPLYLSCVPNTSLQVWYKRQSMGVNKINDMMKFVIKGTTQEDSLKIFSNHSARKTVAKKLKTAGLERSSILTKVTGHRDYREQRQLSHTISHAKKHQQPISSRKQR